ncbi:non-muscle caldesmon isoform X2 [Xyrauchen texanus]|uniref:non-muscle caldesmon isoform X2 n=1 Tax=Xyrauchen texanus TaxID=154827 RepID=UPI002242720A|nr:non-muscle caldesmon isoform X2 [Xyrauchen texanus]
MSSAIMRRSSSKQGLQNLLRVTAQRSIEDAEEIERERRRRIRETFRNQHSLSGSAGSPQDSASPHGASLYEGDLSTFKPSSPMTLDEDEGFSDWTQRLERGTRPRPEKNGPEETLHEEDKRANARSRQKEKTSFTTSMQHHQTQNTNQEDEVEVEGQRLVRKSNESVNRHSPEEWHEDIRNIKRTQQETKPPTVNKMKEERKEVKVSYTSKVFLQQDSLANGNGVAAVEEVTSHLVKTKRSPRIVGTDRARETKKEMDTDLEAKLKLEKICRSHQENESQELEHLRQHHAEAELELEELKKKREECHKACEEEERRKEEEEQQKQAKEEGEKRQMKEEIERRRMEATEKRMKNLNTSSTDGDDPFNTLNPMNPTFKITERTESLNRSLKKSNSFKKTQKPVLLPKIDDKLEQYTHAIESSSKEPKSVVVDVPYVSAPVASKKNLFESGETWIQTTPKVTPSKDTDCVKAGVANLINHWVKGSPEGGNRHSPSTPSDVKPGDVLQKKNMWEIIGEGSAAERSGLRGKGSFMGKRYKFVVTGHGKYKKISTDDDYSVYPNGEFSNDDL